MERVQAADSLALAKTHHFSACCHGLVWGCCRDLDLTLACVLDKDSNRALQQLLSVSNTCSGQVLDFSNTSSRPLSPFRLVSAGSKAPQQC